MSPICRLQTPRALLPAKCWRGRGRGRSDGRTDANRENVSPRDLALTPVTAPQDWRGGGSGSVEGLQWRKAGGGSLPQRGPPGADAGLPSAHLGYQGRQSWGSPPASQALGVAHPGCHSWEIYFLFLLSSSSVLVCTIGHCLFFPFKLRYNSHGIKFTLEKYVIQRYFACAPP